MVFSVEEVEIARFVGTYDSSAEKFEPMFARRFITDFFARKYKLVQCSAGYHYKGNIFVKKYVDFTVEGDISKTVKRLTFSLRASKDGTVSKKNIVEALHKALKTEGIEW